MVYETLIMDDRETSVWLTLNRPDALNSISPEMIGDLNAALDGIEERATLSALIITGAGQVSHL